MNDLVDFEALQITLASPENIKEWSHGEVTKPETINYRTLKPEKDGLFDERIFGPTKDWECYCGKYKRIRYRGVICDKCGVEVTQSRVRRERMGHISLAAPVAHSWFFKGSPSKLGLLMDVSPRNLESVIYFAAFLVTEIDPEEKEKVLKKLIDFQEERRAALKKEVDVQIKELEGEAESEVKDMKKKKADDFEAEEVRLKSRQKIAALRDNLILEESRLEEVYKGVSALVRSIKALDVLSEEEYLKLVSYDADSFLKVGMGAEALLKVLETLDLAQIAAKLREEVTKTTGQKHIKATKKLRVVEGMRKATINPVWMIVKILPVLPPDLRPMVQLSGGRFATSDLNDLYRRVINRNNRLKKLIDLGAPEIILRNEKRMLQEAVDALIDSSDRSVGRVVAGAPLRSLSDMLRGKQGRFRQNLLGKRVDYSGRSVIVVGPELRLDQVGVPKEMALEMFKPFVLRELIGRGLAPNVKSAKHTLERRPPEVWDILEDITINHPVLLNRAPTLHRLGIQAFYPVLIEGDAIRIHPCVCAGFNADFDGDQMAIHVPLSVKSQEEAKTLMMAKNNLLRPADGSPITLPNKEMALGSFYLTTFDAGIQKSATLFADGAEAWTAWQNQKILLRGPIDVMVDGKVTETSVGRIIFNSAIPSEMGYINEPVKASTIKSLVMRAINLLGEEQTAFMIDRMKVIGFGAATFSGLSVSVFDNKTLPGKDKIIAESDEKVAQIEKNVNMGLITAEEQRRLSNEIWIETTETLYRATWNSFPEDNAVRIIAESGGARAGAEQIKQLAGMKGLVNDPSGRIVPLPIKSNFREGLSVFEYFNSARGARKGLADRALKTADSGYLTRRLVDVAHDAIVRLEDCQAKEGFEIAKGARQMALSSRIIGRFLASDVTLGKKVLYEAGTFVDEKIAQDIEKSVDFVMMRSPLTCQAPYGLCAKCYGIDLTSRKMATLGTPVGVMAAQSIGEPGTQLTMRTFHTGGIVGLDITQGLPRVEELFEARTPKYLSQVIDISGKVSVEETPDGVKVTVKSVGVKPSIEREYILPSTSQLKIANGDLIAAGTPLSDGYMDAKQILNVMGLKAAQRYIVDSVQEVYELQGVPINDKHVEIIVRKMCEKVKIETSGDTALLPGELVDKSRFASENNRVLAEGGEPSTARVVILGITKASLYTESFLSAASFQETTHVLTESAAEGKIDRLLGLKENVIIGRLIPTSPDRAVMNQSR